MNHLQPEEDMYASFTELMMAIAIICTIIFCISKTGCNAILKEREVKNGETIIQH